MTREEAEESIRRFCAEAELSEDVSSAFFEYVLLDIQSFIDDDSEGTERDEDDEGDEGDEGDDRLYSEEEILGLDEDLGEALATLVGEDGQLGLLCLGPEMVGGIRVYRVLDEGIAGPRLERMHVRHLDGATDYILESRIDEATQAVSSPNRIRLFGPLKGHVDLTDYTDEQREKLVDALYYLP